MGARITLVFVCAFVIVSILRNGKERIFGKWTKPDGFYTVSRVSAPPARIIIMIDGYDKYV